MVLQKSMTPTFCYGSFYLAQSNYKVVSTEYKRPNRQYADQPLSAVFCFLVIFYLISVAARFKKNDQNLLNLEKNCLGGVKSELAFPIGKKVKHVAFNGQKTYKMLYTTTNSGAKKSKSNSSDSKLLHTVVKLSRNFLEGQPVIIFLMALSVMSKISLPDTLL